MATRKCVTISISPELHAVAEQMLASGRYSNFSEVVRAGLRLLDEHERRIATGKGTERSGERA